MTNRRGGIGGWRAGRGAYIAKADENLAPKSLNVLVAMTSRADARAAITRHASSCG